MSSHTLPSIYTPSSEDAMKIRVTALNSVLSPKRNVDGKYVIGYVSDSHDGARFVGKFDVAAKAGIVWVTNPKDAAALTIENAFLVMQGVISYYPYARIAEVGALNNVTELKPVKKAPKLSLVSTSDGDGYEDLTDDEEDE